MQSWAASFAVALCGAIWGVYWLPLRYLNHVIQITLDLAGETVITVKIHPGVYGKERCGMRQ